MAHQTNVGGSFILHGDVFNHNTFFRLFQEIFIRTKQNIMYLRSQVYSHVCSQDKKSFIASLSSIIDALSKFKTTHCRMLGDNVQSKLKNTNKNQVVALL